MKAALSVVLGLVVIVALAGSVTGAKNDPPPKPKAPNCQKVLDKPKHGKEAVDALGANGEKVAAKHGKSKDKFASDLIADPSTWVDPCGELFYQENDEIPVDPPQDASTLIFPREQTFTLHSKAGSTRVLYIDFNGELVSGTAWNANYNSGQDIAASAFDMDGSPSTFNDDEMAIIQNVWLRVAEDYQPFDVDVTTADPGLSAIDRDSNSDTAFGSRVLVTNVDTIATSCGCAGISYVGVFDMVGSHQYYQPSWAFQRATGANAKVIGEVVAHEAGHSLGLSHEGTTSSAYYSGQGSWAPIMGTAYNRPVSQWSKGQYANANNTEDEFAVMQSHGLALRADTVGNTQQTATALQSGVAFNSRINSAADTDWFSITGSGQISIIANVAPMSPDLDLGVWVYNASGTLVGQSDPPAQTISGDQAAGLSINATFTLPASGTYYVKLDGVGYGDPAATGYSDYASTGEYTLTVTAFDPSSAPTIATASLPAAVFGQPYSASLTGASGVPPYSFGIASGSAAALPNGLTLSANSGAISGSPTGAAGTYNITFKIIDSQGNSTTKLLPISVGDAALQVTSALPLAPASVGVPYNLQLTAAGGRGSYVWSVASGTLPLGTMLSTGGILSGTPTTRSSYSFTVRVTSGSTSVTKSLSVTVTVPLKVTTVTLADGSINTAYSAMLAATGGTGSYVWDIVSGNLPNGLYQTTKYVKGTPTATGSWTFTARATDTAGRVATSDVTITVYGPPSITSDAPLPGATSGVFYEFQFQATGGKQPYKFAKSSGTIPRGLTLATTGRLYGTTTYIGTYTIVVKVTDASGRRYATKTFTLVVAPTGGSSGSETNTETTDSLAITTTELPSGTKGVAYSFTMAASGGTPSYTWARASGSFPKGVNMSTAGVISGTPTATGTYSIKFKCTDGASKVVYVTLSLVVF